MSKTKPVILIAGPTASGKSQYALNLAAQLNCQQGKGAVIINADSQQVYKELPILSAQPAPQELALTPHRLYGCWSHKIICNAGLWASAAAVEIRKAWKTEALPIVCGGTGFYLLALLEGLKTVPDIDMAKREEAVTTLQSLGLPKFYEACLEIDPATVQTIEKNDAHRLLRLWEVFHGTNKPLSWWRAPENQTQQTFLESAAWQKILLSPPRQILYERINSRAARMLDSGAIEETESLLALGLPAYHPLMKAVGVQEIGRFLAGKQSRATLLDKLQQRTRNFAKRQVTWFRHQFQADQVVNSTQPLPFNRPD